jgi:hypothetical protein
MQNIGDLHFIFKFKLDREVYLKLIINELKEKCNILKLLSGL